MKVEDCVQKETKKTQFQRMLCDYYRRNRWVNCLRLLTSVILEHKDSALKRMWLFTGETEINTFHTHTQWPVKGIFWNWLWRLCDDCYSTLAIGRKMSATLCCEKHNLAILPSCQRCLIKFYRVTILMAHATIGNWVS